MDNGTWIFIVEGLATITPGGISFHALQDYPKTARFLSKPERDLAANCWEKPTGTPYPKSTSTEPRIEEV